MVTGKKLENILAKLQEELVEYFNIRSEYSRGYLDCLSEIRSKFNLKSKSLEDLRAEVA